MPKKLNSGLLRIVALMLLCSLTLTGCLGPEGSSTTHSGLTQDIIQDCTSENTVPQITTTIHEHTFKDATCTEAATCIVCGKTKGSTTEHKWKSATCTTPKTCKVCGNTKGSTAAHKYSKGKCTTCGDKDPSYGESSSSMVWIPTNGGKKYHSHSGCSNMKNPEKVSLSKAKKLGFTACKKCYG